MQMGNDVVVSVQAVMKETVSAQALLSDIDRVEIELKQQFPVVRWSFFEPDREAEAGAAAPV
jgi:hypothetical protein